ncbi:hypothetical protein SAMN05216358_0023 [Rhizobium sp. AN5]|uniref:hypothetical protein n=1 Tax=Rhizobium sp. AN5 TaxID=1855304 RepID=UPI000BD67BB9|nr:hypothetical protein [Rhizobium sp. AN5]SOC90007.1 hypothetical protein SAMN05216358_0023 [Rhizobium sp. AN5]
MASSEQNDVMRDFYDRRHPGYHEQVTHWRFLDLAYRGGRDWFRDNIFRYFKEGDKEYDNRLSRAYRFNHTKEVVELVQKYLFKGEITRNTSDAPDVVNQFWKKATRGGTSIDQLMRLVSVGNSTGGRVAIVVDNNFQAEVETEGGKRPVSIAEAKAQNYRIYAYTVPVKDILDFAYDEDGDGELLWVKLREIVRDDRDPFHSRGELIERVRLWTRDGWELYEEQDTGKTKVYNGIRTPIKRVELVDFGYHNLGFVPVYFADHTINEDAYRVTSLIDDIAYLDRAVANYLSNLDAIIQDQTFSQLAIPSQAIQSGDDMFDKVLEMGTKRIFVYDAGAGSSAKPEYLSPDPKQAGVILSVINKIINEIYNTVGLAGERTKEDNAVGIDNSSGVAKAYDFERVNSLLLAKAQSCQNAENWMVKTVLAWAGESAPKDDLVTYPTTFDIMGLNDELVTAEALAKLSGPIEVRREQMKSVIEKIFPQLKKELRAKLFADIDKWLEGTDVLPLPTSIGGTKSAAAPNRQGEVTRATPAKPNTTKAAAK